MGTPSRQEVVAALGSADITLNKLALLAKVRLDGSTKFRFIWDLLRSGVNSRIHQGERIILPRPLDVVQDALELALGMPHDESIFFLGTDVLDAFHQIPLRREEWRFTVSEFMGFLSSKSSSLAPAVHPRFGADT